MWVISTNAVVMLYPVSINVLFAQFPFPVVCVMIARGITIGMHIMAVNTSIVKLFAVFGVSIVISRAGVFMI